MPKVDVTIANPKGSTAKGLVAECDAFMERIRKRAYDLFEQRGSQNGADRDDWLQAERELMANAKVASAAERGRYTLTFSIPGMTRKALRVYALGNRLVVKGSVAENSKSNGLLSEQSRTLFYEWPLPASAFTKHITAELTHGALIVHIPMDVEKPATVASLGSKTKIKTTAAAAA